MAVVTNNKWPITYCKGRRNAIKTASLFGEWDFMKCFALGEYGSRKTAGCIHIRPAAKWIGKCVGEVCVESKIIAGTDELRTSSKPLSLISQFFIVDSCTGGEFEGCASHSTSSSSGFRRIMKVHLSRIIQGAQRRDLALNDPVLRRQI